MWSLLTYLLFSFINLYFKFLFFLYICFQIIYFLSSTSLESDISWSLLLFGTASSLSSLCSTGEASLFYLQRRQHIIMEGGILNRMEQVTPKTIDMKRIAARIARVRTTQTRASKKGPIHSFSGQAFGAGPQQAATYG